MPRPFKHQPLDNPHTSIRLLKIHPGSGETVQCGLTQGALGDRPYQCLSYTWAPDKPRHQILVNGGSYQVGDNLWRFLQAARSAGVANPLWIDAICINQVDTREKNHQVNRMKEIYSGSERTLIWLGPLSQPVQDLLKDMSSTAERFRLDKGEPWDYGRRVATQEMFRNETAFDQDSRSGMVSDLFSVQYWTRTWIAQEIVLSPAASIFTATEEVDIDCLSVVLEDAKSHDSQTSSRIGWRLLDWRQTRLDKTSSMDNMNWNTDVDVAGASVSIPRLWTLFPLFSANGCQNPVDRVYGALSLAKNTAGFKVEYAWSVENVLRYTLEFCMADRTIDELLVTGAHLVEALELRPHLRRSTYGGKSQQKPAPTKIAKRGTFPKASNSLGAVHLDDFSNPSGGAPWAISTLQWSKADLHYCQDTEHPGDTASEVLDAVYFAVRNGSSVHVFEYAVARPGDGTRNVVKYARAHEYVRGEPRMGEDNLQPGRKGMWVDLPSEDVWYYDGPSFADSRRPGDVPSVELQEHVQSLAGRQSKNVGTKAPASTPGNTKAQHCSLWSWMAPNIEVSDDSVYKIRQNRLEPSIRTATSEAEPWDTAGRGTSNRQYAQVFLSAKEKVMKDIQKRTKDGLGQGESSPPSSTARPSTVFVGVDEDGTFMRGPFPCDWSSSKDEACIGDQ